MTRTSGRMEKRTKTFLVWCEVWTDSGPAGIGSGLRILWTMICTISYDFHVHIWGKTNLAQTWPGPQTVTVAHSDHWHGMQNGSIWFETCFLQARTKHKKTAKKNAKFHSDCVPHVKFPFSFQLKCANTHSDWEHTSHWFYKMYEQRIIKLQIGAVETATKMCHSKHTKEPA